MIDYHPSGHSWHLPFTKPICNLISDFIDGRMTSRNKKMVYRVHLSQYSCCWVVTYIVTWFLCKSESKDLQRRVTDKAESRNWFTGLNWFRLPHFPYSRGTGTHGEMLGSPHPITTYFTAHGPLHDFLVRTHKHNTHRERDIKCQCMPTSKYHQTATVRYFILKSGLPGWDGKHSTINHIIFDQPEDVWRLFSIKIHKGTFCRVFWEAN